MEDGRLKYGKMERWKDGRMGRWKNGNFSIFRECKVNCVRLQ
jgi:hypothetical protein